MVENYDLSGQGEWLEGAWAGDGVERRSLHDLADEFNQCVLKAAMIEAGIDPLQKAVVNTYEILTDK